MSGPSAVLDTGMLRGISALRWLALAWAAVGAGLQWDELDRPALAVGALAVACVVTVVAAWAVEVGLGRAFWTRFATVEVVAAVGLLVVDGVVYEATRDQSLPWAWPAAGIVTAAVIGGLAPGLAAALVVAGGSVVGEGLLRDDWELTGGTLSKSALFVLAAVVAQRIAARLRASEAEIEGVRAREHVARELHDGVLQTLAVIQRRGAGEDVVALAREQERDLREFLAGRRSGDETLGAALGSVISTARRRFGLDVRNAVAADLPRRADLAGPLGGAVSEALANAGKHSGAERVVVFAEPGDDGGVFCSVRDDGIGFDASALEAPRGLRDSIERPIHEIGGRVEIESVPGRGTEVRIWVI